MPASYPLPTNKMPGDPGFVADINQHATNINDLNERVNGRATGIRATRTTAQTCPAGTWVRSAYTAQTVIGPAAGLTRGTDMEYTVNVGAGGLYDCRAQILWAAGASGTRNLRIETFTGTDPGIGSATVVAQASQAGVTGTFAQNVSGLVTLAAGDKIRLSLAATGGNVDTVPAGGHWLSLHKIA